MDSHGPDHPMRYAFKPVMACDMCGSPPAEHRVLGKRLNASQGKFPGRRSGITVTVKKCRCCELVFADPQPVPFDIEDHYGVPPEDYWTGEYFKVSDNYFRMEIDLFDKLRGFRTGMRALDIGAGLGKGMIAMERAGFEVEGFEPSSVFRERAISRMGIDPGRLRLGSMETADYGPDEFDLISFGAVLEHLYSPSGSIAKALSWLRPNGLIQVQVPSSRWLVHRIINCTYRLQGTDYVANLSPMHPPYHLFEFGVESFKANAVLLGYEIAQYEHFVCETYLPKVLDPLLKTWMRGTGTGMQLSIWLRRR